MRRQLQCNALHGREKSRRRKNRREQGKKQGAEQWKQAKIQESDLRAVVRRKRGDGIAREALPTIKFACRICG